MLSRLHLLLLSQDKEDIVSLILALELVYPWTMLNGRSSSVQQRSCAIMQTSSTGICMHTKGAAARSPVKPYTAFHRCWACTKAPMTDEWTGLCVLPV